MFSTCEVLTSSESLKPAICKIPEQAYFQVLKFPTRVIHLYVSSAHLSARYQRTLWATDSSVGTATTLRTGRSTDRIPVRVRFSAHVQASLGPTQPPLYNGYRVFPWCKAARTWHWAPTPFIAKVKERVELYIYSPSGLSWAVLGWPLPLHYQWT
jgi:hypothetical protein